MTGGVVVVLGETGRNFASGMTNGTAYVLDLTDRFPERCNPEYVSVKRITAPEDVALVRALIERHVSWTGSRWAQVVLERWEEFLSRFWKVVPHQKIETAPERPARRGRQAVAAGQPGD